MNNHFSYWMAFAHARNFSNRRKIDFLIQSVHDKMTIENALIAIKQNDKLDFKFTDKEWEGLKTEVNKLPNYSFLYEELTEQGYELINIFQKGRYPQVLKDNLKKNSPIIIYTKGNRSLLDENTVAIVGARKSGKKSLTFTDNISKKMVNDGNVIVSGFAKGVDRKALDSALKYKGKSIIVLPQGILTYTTKKYYEHIVEGDVLLLSTYHPKAPWSVGLAMDRNKTIYGLSSRIYVAESNNKGGTWEGVKNGLKRKRTIYIRTPDDNEKNANKKLIKLGAIPVDADGHLVNESHDIFTDDGMKYEKSNTDIATVLSQVIESRNGKPMTISEIKSALDLEELSAKKLTSTILDSGDFSKGKRGRLNTFTLKKYVGEQSTLF